MNTQFPTFTPTDWATAADKEKFAKQFIKFVESDFAMSKFPKWFYQRLSGIFGHIAHYDQHGFYAEFFTNNKDKAEFLAQTLRYPSYGSPEYTYCDVEKFLKQWVTENELLTKYSTLAAADQDAADRATYERLKAKFDPA